MKRLSMLIELARNGKRLTASLTTQSPPKRRVQSRGAILGARRIMETAKVDESRDLQKQEDAVLMTLLEQPTRNMVYPLNRLSEQVLPVDLSNLRGILQRMQERGEITLAKNAEGELGAKLTLKGSVVALYGSWLLESCQAGEKRPSLIQLPSVQLSP